MSMATLYRALAPLLLAAPLAAQGNLMMPVPEIETRLAEGAFQIVDSRGSRFSGDRTSRVALSFDDGQMMVVKWARAHRSGEAFNNQPRFEMAAYELQKLFLDEADYVVPPTAIRAFPLDWYRELEPGADATLGTRSVVTVLQYWLLNVTGDDYWDDDRFESDEAYRRAFGNFNIFTYLIRHNDANEGNYLISRIASSPRLFAVDNGLSFSSAVSDRGARWRSMRVDVLPAETVERLRGITREQLTATLSTVAEFRKQADGTLVAVAPSASIDPGKGVRQNDEVVQFGLTEREIREVWERLRDLLADIDDGDYEVR